MWSFFSRDPSKDFNYDIGEPVNGLEDKLIWKLHKGKKKVTGEPVSIFIFDIKNGSDVQLDIAKTSLKKLKTLRHPCITTFLDSLETDKLIYMVTEYVEPLANYVTNNELASKQKELSISWGLHQVIKGIHFLNNDCSLVHNNICMWSVFVNQAGEWKLGSLEFMCPFAEISNSPVKILPLLEKYDPPEKNDLRSKNVKITKWSTDMWGIGCLMWEVFNGPLNKSSSLKNPGKIPKSLVPHYCELVGANPSLRPNPQEFLSRCQTKGGYFNNNFVNTLLFLEEIQIKDNSEKTKFFGNLTPVLLDSFPQDICKYKILPQLLYAFEFGNAGSAVLSPMFKLGKLLDEEEYQKKIVPCLIKLFSSTDRSTRARLLQQMEHFVDHLQPSLINDQIFPQVIHGFLDTNPTIREITVKAMLYLAPKLNYNNLNVELMKHFARLQAKDDQGGIRTNTTICLGKIATFLHPQIRQKVLVAAFTRAMRDPFPPARTAGIMALAATQNYYTLRDVASKVIPALSPSCTDPEKSVRDQAFRTIKGFLGKLERASEDPSAAAELEAEVNVITSPTMVDTAASWAGWAVTSLTSKFYKPSKTKSADSQDQPKTERSSSEPNVEPSSKAIITDVKDNFDKLQVESEKIESDTDDEWNDDWGQMDISSSNKTTELLLHTVSKTSEMNSAKMNDWEEDWANMDEEKQIDTFSVYQTQKNEWNEEMVESGFVPTDPNLRPASSYNWETTTSTEDFFSTQKPLNRQTSQPIMGNRPKNSPGSEGWDVDDAPWDTWQPSSSEASMKHTDKMQREERRMQRQKELQEKRAARQTLGAMKLGSKKK